MPGLIGIKRLTGGLPVGETSREKHKRLLTYLSVTERDYLRTRCGGKGGKVIWVTHKTVIVHSVDETVAVS